MIRINRFAGLTKSPFVTKSIQNFSTRSMLALQQRSGVLNVHKADELPNKKKMTVDHELPDPLKEIRRNRMIFVAFGVAMSLSLFGIFNYEKTSSPVMNATMYFLRRSEVARSKLGKEITFAGLFPWIRGELNTMIGNVDISVDVLGTKGKGTMILKLNRDSRLQEFKIEKWDLIIGGEVIDLLKDESIEFSL